jgi:hypothetical protein
MTLSEGADDGIGSDTIRGQVGYELVSCTSRALPPLVLAVLNRD